MWQAMLFLILSICNVHWTGPNWFQPTVAADENHSRTEKFHCYGENWLNIDMLQLKQTRSRLLPSLPKSPALHTVVQCCPWARVRTFGLVVECWTGVQEVMGMRLSGITTFGVRSDGSYAYQSMAAEGDMTLQIQWPMGLAGLTWGWSGSNLWYLVDENTRL